MENPDAIPERLQDIMESVVSGGVSVAIHQIGPDGRPFCFSIDGANPYYSFGRGFGNTDTDPLGGQLAYPL